MLSLLALLIVVALCALAASTLGPTFHQLVIGDQIPNVPDDASALFDGSLATQAPCDTCDGAGEGHIEGELVTCPVCRGSGVVEL